MEISTTAPNQRIFDAEQLVRFSDEKATVTEVAVTSLSSIAVWGVRPGQEVPAHTHPDGQDTWIVLRGSLTYFLGGGQSRRFQPVRLISQYRIKFTEPKILEMWTLFFCLSTRHQPFRSFLLYSE